MEELLCIGCGAKIQIEDKEKAGYTPKAALEKVQKVANCIAKDVLDYVITMKSPMCTLLMMNFETSTRSW